MTIDPTPKSPLDGLVSCGACGAPMEYEAPTQDHEASYACRSGHTSGGDSRPQSSGTEPIPPAILPTYEGQTWIDIDRLNYRFDRPAPNPNPEFHREPVEDAIQPEQTAGNDSPHGGSGHGSRCHICYDESDLNIRIAPDYYFAKDVPGGERYGLSVHQAAALVLARRLLGCSERIPRRWVCPVGSGVHVAFTVPARKRVKHVWTYWGAVSGQLRPALAAQHRLGKARTRTQSGSGCRAG